MTVSPSILPGAVRPRRRRGQRQRVPRGRRPGDRPATPGPRPQPAPRVQPRRPLSGRCLCSGAGWYYVLWDIGGDKAPRKVMELGKSPPSTSPPMAAASPLGCRKPLGLYDPATGELRKRLTVAPMHGVGSFHPDGQRIMLVALAPHAPADRHRKRQGGVVALVRGGDRFDGLARRWAALRGQRQRPPDLRMGHGRQPAPVGPGRPSEYGGRPPVHPCGRPA